MYGQRVQGWKTYDLNQSALPIIHGINGDKPRGGWEDRDLENDCNSSVCECVHTRYRIEMAQFLLLNKGAKEEAVDLQPKQIKSDIVLG